MPPSLIITSKALIRLTRRELRGSFRVLGRSSSLYLCEGHKQLLSFIVFAEFLDRLTVSFKMHGSRNYFSLRSLLLICGQISLYYIGLVRLGL